MTTPTEDARAALAAFEGLTLEEQASCAWALADALRALIEPPEHASPLSMSPEHGKFGAENLQFEPPTDDEREALKVALTEGYWKRTGYRVTWENIGPLMDAILAAGFRRQVSHPEPEEWEYGQSEVLDDGTVAYGGAVDTLEEAIRRRDIARASYPWPDEIGVGRRTKPGPWLPVPEEET